MNKRNEVRIIGGKFKSRKIKFSHHPLLRPTESIIRETLFNWIQDSLEGKDCLDMFAGSGALGFEAISRGANHVVMLDQSRSVIYDLKKNAEILNIKNTNIDFICKIFSFNMKNIFSHKFDVVFIDPPFYKGLCSICLNWLVAKDCLNNNAFIYVECESKFVFTALPTCLKLVKNKTQGQVSCYLFENNFDSTN